MDAPLFHVLLEGRRVGPYDRRTIVGMRIRQTLTSEHVLLAGDGAELTVADLLKSPPRDNHFQPNRSGSYSLVQARYSASLAAVRGKGRPIPRFKGEVEVRVQEDVLRIAGRHRSGFGWREDRVKLPLKHIAHARLRGSQVDLWLKYEGVSGFQQLTLELFTAEAAGEFVEYLPGATPWPWDDVQRGSALGHPMIWAAVVGTVVVIAVVLTLVLIRRH